MRGRTAPFLDGDCSAYDSIVGPIFGHESVPTLGPTMRYQIFRHTPDTRLGGYRRCAGEFGNALWAPKRVPEVQALNESVGVQEVPNKSSDVVV